MHIDALTIRSKLRNDPDNMDLKRELQSLLYRLLDKIVIAGFDVIDEQSELWARNITITGEVFSLLRGNDGIDTNVYLGRYGFGNSVRGARKERQIEAGIEE